MSLMQREETRKDTWKKLRLVINNKEKMNGATSACHPGYDSQRIDQCTSFVSHGFQIEVYLDIFFLVASKYKYRQS